MLVSAKPVFCEAGAERLGGGGTSAFCCVISTPGVGVQADATGSLIETILPQKCSDIPRGTHTLVFVKEIHLEIELLGRWAHALRKPFSITQVLSQRT